MFEKLLYNANAFIELPKSVSKEIKTAYMSIKKIRENKRKSGVLHPKTNMNLHTNCIFFFFNFDRNYAFKFILQVEILKHILVLCIGIA